MQAVEAGIDSWRVLRVLSSDRDVQCAMSRCTVPSRRGAQAAERVGEHVLGVMPGHRLLWLEGHPKSGGLAPARELARAYERLMDAIEAAAFPLGEDAGISRLDSAVTLRFPRGQDGHAVLAGVGALD